MQLDEMTCQQSSVQGCWHIKKKKKKHKKTPPTSQNHRVAQVGKDLKDHQVQLQP